MARVTGATVSYEGDGNAVNIHVHGDMMPCHIHAELIDIIKENSGRSIHFTVDYPAMLLLIRESIPREYYSSLDVRKCA